MKKHRGGFLKGTIIGVTIGAKRLVNEGAAVMSELERMTKKIMSSAKQKLDDQADVDGDRSER
jgi:hypothetical protein